MEKKGLILPTPSEAAREHLASINCFARSDSIQDGTYLGPVRGSGQGRGRGRGRGRAAVLQLSTPSPRRLRSQRKDQ